MEDISYRVEQLNRVIANLTTKIDNSKQDLLLEDMKAQDRTEALQGRVEALEERMGRVERRLDGLESGQGEIKGMLSTILERVDRT